jgi:predicted enzyme related to lactoylglutathione lyase
MSEAKLPSTAGTMLRVVMLGVADIDKSIGFYSRVFGFTVTRDTKGAAKREVMLALNADSMAAGSFLSLVNHTDGVTRNYKNNPVMLVFYVTDVPGAAERLKAEGATFSREVATLASGRMIAIAKDPDGYDVEIITP